jgi:flagellar protein FliL
MSEPEKTDAKPAAAKKPGMVMLVVVGALAVGGGVGTPLLISKLSGDEAETTAHARVTKIAGIEMPEPGSKTTFIDFEEVVVNLNESRFNRYLKLGFSLQIASTQKSAIETLIKQKQVVLKNWLISHIADKSLEDVGSKIGHNRLRREIHDQFNLVLFDDGVERVQDVLFKEFNIQ